MLTGSRFAVAVILVLNSQQKVLLVSADRLKDLPLLSYKLDIAGVVFPRTNTSQLLRLRDGNGFGRGYWRTSQKSTII